MAISQYHVGYHESSGENVTAFPRLHSKGTSSRFALRAPRPHWGLAMTHQAVQRCTSALQRLNVPVQGAQGAPLQAGFGFPPF